MLSRIFESAWTRSQLEQRYLAVTPESVHQFQELLSHMIYPNSRLRPASDRLARNELGQSGLWSLGISGDLPILTVLLQDQKALHLAREVLLAHTYWRMHGFRADVVLLNQEAAAYDQPLNTRLQRLLHAHTLHTGIDVPGGAFLRDWNSLSDAQRNVTLAASRVVLVGSKGRLGRQLVSIADAFPPVLTFNTPASSFEGRFSPSNLPFMELDYFNGIGGFSRTETEYCVYLDGRLTTPRPWVNVIAGPSFGSMVTESGLGFTWSGNSQSNRLTPWRNDPVSDPPSEALYLRDEENGEVWSPTAQPARDSDAYRVRHGQGYSVYEHNHHGLEQELTIFVPDGQPVKVSRLRIINRSQQVRKLSLFYYVEWVLGTDRESSRMHIRCSWDEESGALIAQNVWNPNYSTPLAFQALSPKAISFTTDRLRFLGRNGSYQLPQALVQASLGQSVNSGLDPCGALQTSITLQPGETKTVIGMLGQAHDKSAVLDLVAKFSPVERTDASFADTKSHWRSLLNRLQFKTPVHSVNLLLNSWLTYQSLSCRFWGRSAYYQSGGAFGFRDQLQDCLGLVYLNSALTRAHILRSASRQFVEGDVQHWWHPETGAGVRTKCSDDLYWLPYATAHYVEVTGDTGILDESCGFLAGRTLGPGESEFLEEPQHDIQSGSLLEHCLLALQHSENKGSHGLPLMGSGDWNDGMNLVGQAGKGESVWLSWFLIVTLRNFASLLRKVNRAAEAGNLETRADQILKAAEEHCWDGAWYLRAFFDDGSPLGSHLNSEARIDSIAQSWAVMAGAEPVRARTAVNSALKELVNDADGLVHLFKPPFNDSLPHPGYIMGYPPGLRENGGQYTHGSLWLAQACALLGQGNDAVRLLQIMNPIERTRDAQSVARYGGEPYVVAADVYSAPGLEGSCGWTWYTGSASWMYRIWLENVLGFQLRGNSLRIQPSVPDQWNEFSIVYRHGEREYDIQVRRATDPGLRTILLDGQPCGEELRLVSSPGNHKVVVLF